MTGCNTEILAEAIAAIALETQTLAGPAAQAAGWERITALISAGHDIAVLARAMAVLTRRFEANEGGCHNAR